MADSPTSSSSGDYEDANESGAPPETPHGYRLRVTAGPAYDASTHHPALVNSTASGPETMITDKITLTYAIRIKHFTGLPASNETSPYFSHPLHTSDQYSISLAFIPHEDIAGDDLVFGNDFDRPIRDRLPPGFNQAFKFVKWWIDPGLDGDVYADRPYLYGPALSSWNTLRIGDQVLAPTKSADGKKESYSIPDAEDFHENVVEEDTSNADQTVPGDSAARKKFFLTQANREAFVFEKGRLYEADFFNPYLDFNDFSLKLPGFSLNVIKYVDAKTHELRYVLKNRRTGEVYVAFMFTLLWGEEMKELEREEGEGVEGKKGEAKKREAEEKKKVVNTDIPDDDDELD